MRNFFRSAAIAGVVAAIILPAVSRLAGDAAEHVSGAIWAPAVAWLAQVGASAWYLPLVCALAGVAFGAFADWFLGLAEGRRQQAWSSLAIDLDAHKDEIVAILRYHFEQDVLDRGRVYNVLTDLASIELVLKSYGILSPTERWTQSTIKEMDLEKLAELLGYLTLLSPLLKRGQIREARRVGQIAARDSSKLLALGSRSFMIT